MNRDAEPALVVLASGNSGKLRELAGVLRSLDLQLVSQADFGVPEVAETGLSFVENAIIKARAAAAHSGHPALADDSGLEVDYLNGEPGIHSARYSGNGDAANNTKLLAALEGVPEAHARPVGRGASSARHAGRVALATIRCSGFPGSSAVPPS